MALNLDKIKERLSAFQNSANSTSKILWKPSGKSQIRLLPYKHNKDNPFVELYFHFTVSNGKSILSPISYGEADPIVEFAAKLRKSGSKEDFILSRKLEPKMRIFAPVVVRGLENEGTKFWGFGKTVYQEILSFISDPDYGDITDPINGRDISIESLTPLEAGNQFGKTTIRVKPNKTAVVDNKDVLKSLLEDQVNVSEIYIRKTYDELKAILLEYLEPGSEPKEGAKTSVTAKQVDPFASAPSKKVSDVSAAFDDLFNN